MNFTSDKDEFNQLSAQLKGKVQQHIVNNELAEAKLILQSIEKYIPLDAEIYSFKGIISLYEEDKEMAIKEFKAGLAIDSGNSDLLYNLAEVYKGLNDIPNAYRYYQRAKDSTEDMELLNELETILTDLEFHPLMDTHEGPDRKKVLIIAHIFPPLGGSGVQRTLKFTKYLTEFQWKPIIVTTGDSSYPLIDQSLLSEVPENLTIHRINEPTNLTQTDKQELLNVYNTVVNNKEIIDEYISEINTKQLSVVAPDPYIYWAVHVIRKIKNDVDMSDIDIIYTTSGPYSDHLIGYMLKKEFNKPWVADFRDEWTNNPYAEYDPQSSRYKIEYLMEKNITKYADHLVTTTPLTTNNYIQNFHVNPNKISTITNGYDEDDFNGLIHLQQTSNKFSIFHNGLLYSIRTPITFLKAIHNLVSRGLINKEHLHIGFSWTENDELWRKYANDLGLIDQIEFYGYLSHQESLNKALASTALLLIVGPGEKNKSMYPGKIFEYFRLNKPIISLSPINSGVEALLTETGRGKNADFNDIAEIERIIEDFYKRWLREELPKFKLDETIVKFERRELTKNLASTFEKVLDSVQQTNTKTRLAFFSIKDGDKFLHDIIDHLSSLYNIRKFIITDVSQIEPAMEWADICWFEWCDKLIVHASNLSIARSKKVVCRLHRYEVFTEHPKLVVWENVDHLIVVTDHLKTLIKMQVPNLEDRVEVSTIHNGVNLSHFPYKNRNRGYNIAFIGYMISRKNPMLLLQIAKELTKKNPKYKIFIAGDFQDEMLRLYWNYQIKELQLENNVFFHGFQTNMKEWLDDKDYIVATTMHESFGYGIAEAMAMGIKPVIHNFPFSKEIWPQKYLFNTIEEAVRSITTNNYQSSEYRYYIQSNYSLDKQILKTKELLSSVEQKDKNYNANSFNGVSTDYLKQRFNEFIPFQVEFTENYILEDILIMIGKREQITIDLDLIECIIQNKNGDKLILFNIWYNKKTEELILPDYLNRSSKQDIFISLIRNYILRFNLNYRNHIGGYILDPDLQEDVKRNAAVYGWERGIPATQFMTSVGYLRIIERYNKAAEYISEGDVVLDAACGFGYGSAFFSRKASEVIAVDLAHDNITFGKSAYGFNNIKWMEGDVTKLPVEDSTIDIYVSFETIEHLPLVLLDQYFREALRVIKPGGKMIISTPNVENRRHINNPYHIKEYTHSEFQDILKNYFNSIHFYSSENYEILDGVTNKSTNMMAICYNTKNNQALIKTNI